MDESNEHLDEPVSQNEYRQSALTVKAQTMVLQLQKASKRWQTIHR